MESGIPQTFRTAQVVGTYDLKPEHLARRISADIPIEGKEWNVGLIVGSSGTGKSTIAAEAFGRREPMQPAGGAVIDDMPSGRQFKDITRAFVSVGFSSPPSWLKPYSVLSNGEKMRASLAYALLSDDDPIVFDEFTSVVDREVAKTMSLAASKAVRRDGKRFVAVSCHRDVTEWLDPDWNDTDAMRFFTGDAGGVRRCASIYSGWIRMRRTKSGGPCGCIII